MVRTNYKHSIQTKINIGNGNRGKVRTIEQNENNRKKHLGKKAWNRGLTRYNNKIIRKYADKLTGRKIPKEIVDRATANHKYLSGKDNPMFGTHPTEGTRIKQVNSHLNIKLSLEHRKAQSEGHKGLFRTELHRKHLSESLTGKRLTEEHKRNVSIGTKKAMNNEETIKKIKEHRASQIFPKKDSSIEIKIQKFLELLQIDYFKHKYINIEHAYQCDIFIPVQKSKDFFIKQPIIIECDGDFVHCNPNRYKEDFICYPSSRKVITAKERWELDSARTKELESKGFKVIRLWESEIKLMDLSNFNRRIRL